MDLFFRIIEKMVVFEERKIIVTLLEATEIECVGEHIEPDKLNKTFERFYRIDLSRSSNIEGSGRGLAISKKIVELHNGQIWAESHGDMVRICIKLPISDQIA